MTVTDKRPDFLVIGAARAGTTALYEALARHPGIGLTRDKETNYFAYKGRQLTVKGPGAEFINNSITDPETYGRQFDSAEPGQVLGEICPLYLFEPDAPGNIRDEAPDAKLIVVLRNPIDQAWSHYLYARHHAIEPESDFLKALTLEESRLEAGWQPLFGYSRFPRYGEQLARYLVLFPRDQLLVLDYADFRADNRAVQAAICNFIGVAPEAVAEAGEAVNAGGAPKNRLLQELLMRPNPLTAPARILPLSWRRRIRDVLARRNSGGDREVMPDVARPILRDRLKDDVARLSDLLGHDYGHWLD